MDTPAVHPAETPARHTADGTAGRTADGRSARLPRVLRAVAVAACVPYLTLKAAWIAGSHVGVPDGSELLEHRGTMMAVNGITVLMDAAVIVLAFALTRPWGRRLPAWLVVVPLWIATGLLAPIVLGFPLQAVAGLLGGSEPATDSGEPFLDEWVFTVVYSGFGVQALALGGLFARYVRGRWGRLLSGRIRDLPDSPAGGAQREFAAAAAVIGLLLAGVHLVWALGSTAGLSAHVVGHRASSFYLTEGLYAVFALAAAAGAVLLAHRPLPRVRSATALTLGWTGGAAVAAWGGWLMLTSLVADDPLDEGEQPTQLMNLTYSGGMIVGLLALVVGVHHLAERAAPQRAKRG